MAQIEKSSKDAKPFQQVAAILRGRIVEGQWPPGSQLPTWDVMTRELEVARPTLMRAMDRLRQDGFVYSKSTRGTYVSERPPHLSRYGLVFTSHPGQTLPRPWNRFWDTLANQAVIIERHGDLKLPVFYDVVDDTADGYHRLADHLSSQRLGGLICVGTPDLLRLPVIVESDLPKVAIYGASIDPPMPRVYIDHDSFIEQSLDRLLELGRRRIAVLSHKGDGWGGYAPAMARRDVQTKPFWNLQAAPDAAANVVRLLFDADNPTVPDGLIITDDNIVEQALGGVLQSGIRVPEQLEVIVHCNWPAPVPSPVPVHRLGFDVREIIATALELISNPSTDRADVRLLPAVFGEDRAIVPIRHI